MGKHIGFISTRFLGTDGVSLEAGKCATVLERNGHECFWFAGMLDRAPDKSFLVPEAAAHYEKNQWIDQQVFGRKRRDASITDTIYELKIFLKKQLKEFIRGFEIDLIIAHNVLTNPLHIPLGVALTETIAETEIPTVAHHHDFYWERPRFLVNAVGDYLRMAFPPNLPTIEHVVINSAAQEELALRTGISSTIIPNVQDFENPPIIDQKKIRQFRASLGFKPDDVIILQPTHIIPRKGIEHAIQLVEELEDPHYKLIITHAVEAEAYEYGNWLQENALERGVDLRMVNTSSDDPASFEAHDHLISLWDVYPHADFITYPSLYEGFGNAFLDAVYFKKPMLINRYATFVRDIEPKGFDLIAMDGYLTRKTVSRVKEVLTSPERREIMVNTNYDIALKNYSYAVLQKCAERFFVKFFGLDF
ncbi:MAG: glycosyltransferase family 4 protein [Desulfobacterales bacterium]|nr:MAG: glycosyltransferase family 4 protein [Desulfobacterales bacterium]